MTVYIIQRMERKIKMTQEKLNEVLEEHAKWLRTRFSGKQEGRRAYLRGAYLRGAYLSGAYLRGADLRGAYLSGAKAVPHVPIVCPTHGEFIGWKKARDFNGLPVLVQLRIPEQAKRTSATGRKCRCDKAIVVDIKHMDGSTCEKAYSSYDSKFEYEPEKEVSVPGFCEDRFQECAAGIHFFVDKQEAIDYEI